MDIGQAIELLKAGKTVRRRNWMPGRYIRLVGDTIIDCDEETGGLYSPTPSDLLADLMAEDWEEDVE